MEDATKIQLLRDEYLLLQNFYEGFDTRIITIKGWSATVGMAAIGGGFYQTHYLWMFAAAASLIFWLVEALWKSFQYMYSPRIQQLEKAFASGEFAGIAPSRSTHHGLRHFRSEASASLKTFVSQSWLSRISITLTAGIILFVLHALGLVALPHG